ncbi:zinc finger protein RTS2 [Xylogone sp. PMI_703]|nr:zinc finger protein RTS2 [Xylogone sp. PMI_703]
MPHDPGSARHVDKKMKMAGLGRLRWYCTPCQKQCRDANAFKQHTLSESHVHRINNINDLHGTLTSTNQSKKSVHANRFYQTYISDKNHIHLNATKWNSLTEFVKFLGREGLCRVEEKDDGLYIAWIDRSPEAIRGADALKKQELQEAASQKIEEGLLKAQIERAQANRKETPTADAVPLPAEPGHSITFQLTATRKETPVNVAGGPSKKINAFKVAKRSILDEAKKRKRSEQTVLEEPQAKRP